MAGGPATVDDASVAHTITPSRGRRSCVRRAYFRRRNTRHARSLRRVVTVAAVRFFFFILFRSRAIARASLAFIIYTRVCLRAGACVCSGIIALLQVVPIILNSIL